MDANPSVEGGAFWKIPSRLDDREIIRRGDVGRALIIFSCMEPAAARLIRVAQERLFESIVTLSGALQVRLQVVPLDALRRRSG